MPRIVLLTGSCDPSTRGRLACVADALTHAGRSVAAVVPTSHRESGVGPNARFFPARRRDDAAAALTRLAGEGEIIIECFDADAARCAREWCETNADAAPVLIDADAVLQDPATASIVDGVIAPTHAHAERCAEAGIDPARVIVAPCPVQPRAVFEPGGDTALCLTPIGPGRGLAELIDAWAASGCGTESPWVLRFGGPVVDSDFAHELACRAAGCPGVVLTERVGEADSEVSSAAVLIDPPGRACPFVLNAVARARAVFAPEGSPTAEAACEPDGPFVYPVGRGIRGLITLFDRLGGCTAPDLAAPGVQARERLLARHAFTHAAGARKAAHAQARRLADEARPLRDPELIRSMPRTWAQWSRPRQNADNTLRLQRAMLACHSQGLRRVALYGAGAFIKSCADALCEPRLEIVGVIDDDTTKLGRRVFGYPILCPDVALTADLHAVIITAPSAEERIWQRTAWFRQARIRVIPLRQEHAELFSARAA